MKKKPLSLRIQPLHFVHMQRVREPVGGKKELRRNGPTLIIADTHTVSELHATSEFL